MTDNIDWQYISKLINQHTCQPFNITNTHSISGGSINSAYKLQSDTQSYFIKFNLPDLQPMFEAELAGLKEIAKTNTVRVPQAILCHRTQKYSFIILEMLSLSASNQHSDSQLGQKLAALHKIQFPSFGWHSNNTIGSTDQINSPSESWPDFWLTHRIEFQLSLAKKNGCGKKLVQTGEQLCESMHHFFASHKPHPSLLHGDLWSGNAAVTEKNEPIIYDPACYYGDREADIAMTVLFGGFSRHFYDAYHESYPLSPEFSTRKTLYNLYHIINHFNLFGGSYLNQAQNMIDSLLAEIH